MGKPPKASTASALALRLRVPGRRDETARLRDDVGGVDRSKLATLGVQVTIDDAVRIEATRGLDDGAVLDNVAPDAVVEISLQDGTRLFMRAAEAVERLGGAAQRSATRPDEIELMPALPLDAPERGLAAWAIEGLRLLGVDLPAAGAGAVAEAVESKLLSGPGLYRWSGDTLTPVEKTLVAGSAPWLLFLHGTASSTRGSFGGLTAPQNAALWARLAKQYGNRILALEHRTLTESPVENAVQALERLPKGAVLHLVSHSRGGLVGELLCRASLLKADGTPFDGSAFDQRDFDQFDAAGREQLAMLRDALADKRPMVARFVRVACPARGTTLLSARLDRWLNAMLATLGVAVGAVPVPGLGEVYDGLQGLLLAVVKERTDPSTLPGLEAMIPDSPLIKILNRPDLKTAADLSVIKGDSEGSDVLRRLLIWFADAFYGADHDLVVNTSAMVAGLQRNNAREFFDQGPAVDHFHYFANPRTAAQVAGGLLRGDDEAAGFERLTAGAVQGMPRLRSRGNDRRPIAYVLPGITGSHLSAGGTRVWIDPLRLAFGGMKDLAIDAPSVLALELVGLYYGDLCSFLDATHEVRPFPYDWRQSIGDTAIRFAGELRRALDEGARPVRIVAHSMGGLVARAAMLDAEVWSRFRARAGARLVMLGTPNGGSYCIPFMLLGRDALVRNIAALDLTARLGDLLPIAVRWPGALEQLPADAPELFQPRWWNDLHGLDTEAGDWAVPQAADLAAAHAFSTAFARAPFDPGLMLYVAGQADTVDGVETDRAAAGAARIRFTRTAEGDGRVTWKSGIPTGMRAWFTQASHGDLARHEPAFPAIADLLETGTTSRLPMAAPSRGRRVVAPIVREEVAIHPSADDLALAGLGGVPRPARRPGPPRIEVSVMLGHLAFASHPVMIGHYAGDAFAGAEAELDRALDGRLGARRRTGLYPGPIETATVVLDPRKRPQGAIVVGLGGAGDLAAGTLQDVLYRGLAAYAAADEDRCIAVGAEAREPLGVSALLVGSNEGGLSRPACVVALLRAALRLQRLLAAAQPAGRTLARLQIVEGVEYRAVEIWRALDGLRDHQPELAKAFELTGDLDRKPGAIATIGAAIDRDWYIPLQITMPEAASGDRTISFVSASGRARAEATLLDANLGFVERFVRQATAGGGGAGATPSRALFELLWPDGLKAKIAEGRNLRMVLDTHTAAFPWELMDDRRAVNAQDGEQPTEERQPFAVRTRVIRQLIQSRFREPVAPRQSPPRALVVGDPRGEPTSGYAELAGAQDEARAVAAKLRAQSYVVTEQIGAGIKPEEVVMHLFDGAWDVIHIAAHGVVDDGGGQNQTGIVLGGGLVLGSSVFAQLSRVPSLVFVNCCHVGRVDVAAEDRAASEAQRGRRPEFAASVAVELIRLGVRGVVAAGWAVDDMAAERFATVFYERMLAGTTLGEAAQEARASVYEMQPGGTTWGAYQCYGEPDWRLHPAAPLAESRESPRFASLGEAIRRLEQIREALNVGLTRDIAASRAAIAAVEEQARQRGWADKPGFPLALATAWAELGELDVAVGWLDRAIADASASVSVKAVEQHANLSARAAVRVFKRGSRSEQERADAATRIEAARARVEGLVALLGNTAERASLRGSCWKRLAQITSGEGRRVPLEKMAACYGEARVFGGAASFYPSLQQAAAEIALAVWQGKEVDLGTQETVRANAGAADGSSDFWQLVAGAEAGLLGAIGNRQIGRDDEVRLLKPFRDAWRFGGSPLKLMSVLDQFTLFEDVLADGPGPAKALGQALGRMRSVLDSELRQAGP